LSFPLKNNYSYPNTKLNIYPVNTIPSATIPKNVANNLGFKTLLKSIASGKLKPVTAIIKARAVPIATPALVSSLTRGITPAALEYSGTPMSTATNTAKGLFFPAYLARAPDGITPCINAPIPTPIITYIQIFFIRSFVKLQESIL
jgi:hypothetical protein